VEVLQGLSFNVRPGLTLVRGGDGRGKTTLLRLMAGSLAPTNGVIRHSAATIFHEDMADPARDAVVARAWLDERRRQFPDWDGAAAAGLIDAFGLTDHLDKPLYMLSTGTRRKVGLLAAAVGHARLTLIDMPFAALDAASRRVLAELLCEASTSEDRAWVIADCEQPPGLADIRWAGVVDLGD
jgi:ABC-type multidrug transport system ATPase subunit